jgi:hypothetical protein
MLTLEGSDHVGLNTVGDRDEQLRQRLVLKNGLL